MKRSHYFLLWSLRIIAAAILCHAVYLNISGDPGYLQLFNTPGGMPPARLWIGISEMIAVFLLLSPGAKAYGAALGACLMGAAVYFHLTRIGIFLGGHASLYISALTAFACCLALVFFYHKEIELPPCVGMG
jgi:hypothetical protein